jgi:ferric-dicitrate binding protein FerR (iron transport regulator)
MKSPTAVAAVRGTTFSLSTEKDSTTHVAVYNGKVDVGPDADDRDSSKSTASAPAGPGERFEVSGPEEVPGPYEVSLDEWRMIVAGQMISIRKDGKFSEEKFDVASAQDDEFIKRCMQLDKDMK